VPIISVYDQGRGKAKWRWSINLTCIFPEGRLGFKEGQRRREVTLSKGGGNYCAWNSEIGDNRNGAVVEGKKNLLVGGTNYQRGFADTMFTMAYWQGE